MSDATRYPLAWPIGWPRTDRSHRKAGTFGRVDQSNATNYRFARALTIAEGLARLAVELERLGASDTLVSTNVELTTYGTPRSRGPDPADPGAAVYFELKGKPRVLACDRYTRVADNMAAIAAHIDALRRIDRYGVGSLERAFAGYDALPPPGARSRPPWRKVFGFGPQQRLTPDDIAEHYRLLARQHHPDRPGGSHDAMAQLNEARADALAELQGGTQ